MEIASPGGRASPSRNIRTRWGMQQSADQRPQRPRQCLLPVLGRGWVRQIARRGEWSVRSVSDYTDMDDEVAVQVALDDYDGAVADVDADELYAGVIRW